MPHLTTVSSLFVVYPSLFISLSKFVCLVYPSSGAGSQQVLTRHLRFCEQKNSKCKKVDPQELAKEQRLFYLGLYM